MPKNTRHNLGTSGDFDSTPTQLHALPLEEAERIWAEHMARCPGTYLECMANGRGEERARWVLEGFHLEPAINVARALAGTSGVKRPKLPLGQEEEGPKPRATRASAAHYLQRVKEAIADMARFELGTPEWERHRARASACRTDCLRRCEEEGITLEVPEIPRKPREPKRHSFRGSSATL